MKSIFKEVFQGRKRKEFVDVTCRSTFDQHVDFLVLLIVADFYDEIKIYIGTGYNWKLFSLRTKHGTTLFRTRRARMTKAFKTISLLNCGRRMAKFAD